VRAKIEQPEVASNEGVQLSSRLDGAVFRDLEDSSERRDGGVLVVDVEQDSPAWEAGLRKDDIIVSVNRQRVRNLREMADAVELNKRALLLNIQRGEGALFLVIR
ncbi:MAG: PDZ domain-containing protein, partial [Gammaproteobacteria bacterium]|nr:PDZ domain-containing protein [Gammaproteobacteria bacterium]